MAISIIPRRSGNSSPPAQKSAACFISLCKRSIDFICRGLANADLVLTAGGDRTIRSLRAAGVPRDRIYETLDCGVPDSLSKAAHSPSRVAAGHFLHFGRLVFHKGTYLAIEAVAKSHKTVTLDIVGRGPELSRCKKLAKDLAVEDRVRFLDWYESRDDLVASFQNYCGIILPSIEDANGIVVQEAMTVGLVPICLDWGGPAVIDRRWYFRLAGVAR